MGPSTGETLQLRPISIHGDGDKIALPPTVLERLSNSSVEHPWMFRIGILNPDYVFPSSPSLLKWSEQQQHDDLEEEDDSATDDNNDSLSAAHLDELRHKYLAFTHGTVVEFTQEDGFVGLPASVASFLVEQSKISTVFRTKDPSRVTQNDEMDTDSSSNDEAKTPGHLAWGAFDLPDSHIEVTLVQLPKGKAARLMPSDEAIRAGFYGLKDIKLVLEQSIIRTRATLTLNDRIATWHRGKRFDLTCTSVTPDSYNSISCINTDIEIEFDSRPDANIAGKVVEEPNTTETTGRTLMDTAKKHDLYGLENDALSPSPQLPEEPPADASKDLVAHIQFRNPDGKTIARRFWKARSTVKDLFDVAHTIEVGSFNLVTRFPRRVWTVEDSDATLESKNVGTGKEVILIERL